MKKVITPLFFLFILFSIPITATSNVIVKDFGYEWISFNFTGPGNLTIEISNDNKTDWRNISVVDVNRSLGYMANLKEDTTYFFRAQEQGEATYQYMTQATRATTENDQYYQYLVGFFMFGILLWIGFAIRDPWMHIFAAIIPIVMALNIWNDGFINITNQFMKTTFVSLLAGIGFYFLIKPSVEVMQEWGNALR